MEIRKEMVIKKVALYRYELKTKEICNESQHMMELMHAMKNEIVELKAKVAEHASQHGLVRIYFIMLQIYYVSK